MLNIVKKLSKFKSVCKCTECGDEYETNHYDAKKSPLGHLCNTCKKPSGELTQTLLHKFYDYDPMTGILKHRLPQHGKQVGDAIGSQSNTGYLVMAIANKDYLVHRIIWMYVYGYMPEQVDHIDHDKQNNAISNLREVTNQVNSMNCSTSSNSKTKHTGVSFMASRNKYRATITVNKKQIHLGLFDDINDAIDARHKANIKYGFHSNHGK